MQQGTAKINTGGFFVWQYLYKTVHYDKFRPDADKTTINGIAQRKHYK
jgi:hypothetical protein